MHSKAQYIDGKLVGEDGKEVKKISITDLKPPPSPVTDEEEEEEEEGEEHPKRKNITISYETWAAWKEIKGRKNWDAILIDALEIFHKIKKLEDVIIEIALQKPTIIQQIGGSASQVPSMMPRPVNRPTPISHKKKLPFLDEIKEIVEKLEDGQGIRSILTPLEEVNQEDVQVTEEYLIKLSEEAIKRSKNG